MSSFSSSVCIVLSLFLSLFLSNLLHLFISFPNAATNNDFEFTLNLDSIKAVCYLISGSLIFFYGFDFSFNFVLESNVNLNFGLDFIFTKVHNPIVCQWKIHLGNIEFVARTKERDSEEYYILFLGCSICVPILQPLLVVVINILEAFLFISYFGTYYTFYNPLFWCLYWLCASHHACCGSLLLLTFWT